MALDATVTSWAGPQMLSAIEAWQKVATATMLHTTQFANKMFNTYGECRKFSSLRKRVNVQWNKKPIE